MGRDGNCHCRLAHRGRIVVAPPGAGPGHLVYGSGVAGSQDGGLGRASGGRHFELFDGLRAVAVLFVLCSHVAVAMGYTGTEWPGRITNRFSIGVTIFFVISGFLLYRPFVRARMSERSFPNVRRYALRRFLRIMPAYWVALTVLAIWPGLVGVFTGDFWKYYGLLQIYGSTELAEGGIFPAWSLAIELSFYALLPVYAWLITRLTRSPRDLRPEIVGLLALSVLSVASRAVFVAIDYDLRPIFTSVIGTLVWFTPGMALAVLSEHIELGGARPRLVNLLDRRPELAWIAAAVMFAVLTRIGFLGTTSLGQALAELVVQGMVAALVVLPAAFGPVGQGAPRRLLGWQPSARPGPRLVRGLPLALPACPLDRRQRRDRRRRQRRHWRRAHHLPRSRSHHPDRDPLLQADREAPDRSGAHHRAKVSERSR